MGLERTNVLYVLMHVATRYFPSLLSLCLVVSLLFAPGCTFLFFKPSKQFVYSSEVQAYSPTNVYFKTPDGLTLHGWYFRAKEERGTILICHGNVENLSTHVKLDLWLVDAGFNLFIFDYRGYGRSEGAPDVQGINRDAEAALETLIFTLPRSRQDNIIVFGKSLGAAVAVYTVANSPYKNRVKALVLDSPFASYRGIAREKIAQTVIGWPFQYALSWLINEDYSPIKFIKSIAPIPVIIIHGTHDEVVPLHHGRTLYDAAGRPKELWEVTVPGHVKAQDDARTRKKLLDYIISLP
jgi:fermentation-respiration switch protein FrsA (DUF1100 family)